MGNPIIKLFRTRIYMAVFLLLSLLFVGVLGFKILSNFSWVDALYMTVITVTTVGYGDEINYKKTYLGNHSIDNIAEDIDDINSIDYNPTGSDERQFSSNGIRIPTAVLTLTPYEKYKQYHTSEDNLDLISISAVS